MQEPEPPGAGGSTRGRLQQRARRPPPTRGGPGGHPADDPESRGAESTTTRPPGEPPLEATTPAQGGPLLDLEREVTRVGVARIQSTQEQEHPGAGSSRSRSIQGRESPDKTRHLSLSQHLGAARAWYEDLARAWYEEPQVPSSLNDTTNARGKASRGGPGIQGTVPGLTNRIEYLQLSIDGPDTDFNPEARAPTGPVFATEAEHLTRSLHQLLSNNTQDGQDSMLRGRHLPERARGARPEVPQGEGWPSQDSQGRQARRVPPHDRPDSRRHQDLLQAGRQRESPARDAVQEPPGARASSSRSRKEQEPVVRGTPQVLSSRLYTTEARGAVSYGRTEIQ